MSGALDGIRVLDLTRYIPGPYATQTLGDLGADVVKVEEPPFGDATRALPPGVGDDSAPHLALNRNKRSIVVDLRNPEGARLVRGLARDADVFVEAYRPGALRRRGLGPEELLGQNPRLVYCSLTGYGQTGPQSGRAGHDVNYLARAGLLDASRDAAGRPVMSRAQLADMTGGMLAVAAILAALVARERGGRGQHLDVSLHRGALAVMTVPLARLRAGGAALDELAGAYACYNVYRCRDGRYLSVGALEAKFWEALCRALGHADRASRQWAKDPARSETIELFARRFAERDRDDWVRALAGVECCVEPVLDSEEALCDAAAAGALVGRDGAGAGIDVVGAPFGMAGTPGVARRPAPALGQHTDEVLLAAGVSADDLARLRGAGVVA